MYTPVADGEGGGLLVTEEFCLSILDDAIIFKQKEREFEEEFHRSKRRAVSAYKAFVQDEKRFNEANKVNPVPESDFSTLWPPFGEDRYDHDFQFPKQKKISCVFAAAFKLVEKALLQDLFSRTPDSFISWDATFKFLMRTMDDEESGEENNALHIIWGKFGHILSFAFAGSEQDIVFQRLQYFIRERCRRIGGMVEVNKVLYGYNDTCCGGLKDPKAHWFLKIWPSAISWPEHDLPLPYSRYQRWKDIDDVIEMNMLSHVDQISRATAIDAASEPTSVMTVESILATTTAAAVAITLPSTMPTSATAIPTPPVSTHPVALITTWPPLMQPSPNHAFVCLYIIHSGIPWLLFPLPLHLRRSGM
jgi:hypothetical protein